jgi:hypothetical protein
MNCPYLISFIEIGNRETKREYYQLFKPVANVARLFHRLGTYIQFAIPEV